MASSDPSFSKRPKPRDSQKRDLPRGQIVYLKGDTQPYVIMRPTWVVPAPPDPEPKRGGWMP